jgi:hypothetical protein
MAGFQIKRLGLMMEPEPGNPFEVEGVLNPAGFNSPASKTCGYSWFSAINRQGIHLLFPCCARS